MVVVCVWTLPSLVANGPCPCLGPAGHVPVWGCWGTAGRTGTGSQIVRASLGPRAGMLGVAARLSGATCLGGRGLGRGTRAMATATMEAREALEHVEGRLDRNRVGAVNYFLFSFG